MLKIAHRGASLYAPENTTSAFLKAIELGADMIELDVRVCKSGEVVVIHDARVDRTTNGRGEVKRKTLSELKILNAGNGEKILTLTEALTIVNKQIALDINVKESAALEPTVKILDEFIYKKGWRKESFIISSAKFFKLQRIRKKHPLIQTAPIVVLFPRLISKLIYPMHPFALKPHRIFISKKLVEEAHKHSLKVIVWTVNDRTGIEVMKDLKVDGIISNYPDRI